MCHFGTESHIADYRALLSAAHLRLLPTEIGGLHMTFLIGWLVWVNAGICANGISFVLPTNFWGLINFLILATIVLSAIWVRKIK